MFSVMHTILVPLLILWPERDILKMSMPMSFRSKFGKCACIIDCFEVFIERPSDLKARAQTYSTYKSHNTMKFLIGILLHKVQSPLFPRGGGGGRTSQSYVFSQGCPCPLLDVGAPFFFSPASFRECISLLGYTYCFCMHVQRKPFFF